MPNKTIWYISKYAAPNKYGLGTRHFYLAKEWVKQGHNVTVVAGNSSHKRKNLPKFKSAFHREVIDMVPTVWINSIQYDESRSWKRILSWILFEFLLVFFPRKANGKPDVIVISSLSLLTIWSGLWFKLRYGSKLILEIRDIWPLSLLTLSNISEKNLFVRFLAYTEKLGYKKYDVIVGTMPNLRAHVYNILPSAAEKVVTIPQCFDPAFALNHDFQIPSKIRELVGDSNKLKICYAGALSYNNPLDLLLDVAAETPEVEVYVLGKGDDKERIVNKYKEVSNVYFLPFLPKELVIPSLSLFDLAYDSVDSDIGEFGLSRNKWIDYMLAGKPIICAFTGFKSMITESGAGKFVEPNKDSLKSTLIHYCNMNKKQIAEEGLKAKQWVIANRSADVVASDYLTLMETK